MSEDRLLEQRNLGASAGDLLQNEAYLKAISDVKDGIVKVWMACKDSDERERAWQAVNMVEKIAAAIVSTYNNGRLADAELKQIIEKQERKKRFGII